MPLITIQFDPDDPSEAERARELIGLLARSAPPAGTADPPDLTGTAEGLVRGYGEDRRRFLRLVAEAGPDGMPVEQSPVQDRALGGLITSLQRSWRASGATDGPVEWAGQRYRMQPHVAAAILDALDRTEPGAG